MAKLKEDPVAILTVDEDTALNAFQTAEQNSLPSIVLRLRGRRRRSPSASGTSWTFSSATWVSPTANSTIPWSASEASWWSSGPSCKMLQMRWGNSKEAPAGERATKLIKGQQGARPAFRGGLFSKLHRPPQPFIILTLVAARATLPKTAPSEEPWEEEGNDVPEGEGADARASGQINSHQDLLLLNI
ncbi:hypothetical protein VaNZ11_006448 [Volvox africanus]|uniref:Uncharacterized protein n=1 Tax=Volvox africanus TaxID=51714 RepID=A0ABQ5S1I4_9CHLO|nr:hypothetical protein VaNZ11_006448 [Volvox africanus]